IKMSKEIKYQIIMHEGQSKIAVRFAFDKILNERMRRVYGAKWSRIHRCWLIPDNNDNREKM
ncbi:hypothetical protein ABTM22_20425, partial [Acinetobacter baumannii]